MPKHPAAKHINPQSQPETDTLDPEVAAQIINAVDAFAADLHTAHHVAKAAREETSNPHSLETERCEVIASVQAAVNLIRTLPNMQGRERPLWSLLLALHDAQAGKPNPLLRPARAENRPPDNIARQAIRAYAALAMELLVQAGRSDAAEVVARKLHSRGIKPTPSPKTVERWREEAKGRADHDSLMVGRYRALRDEVTTWDRPPGEAANDILDRVIPLAASWAIKPH